MKRINSRYWLPGGIILLGLLCYFLAFQKTMDAWRINKQLNAENLAQNGLSVSPDFDNRKLNNLIALEKRYKVDTATYRFSLINRLSRLTDSTEVRLIDIPTASSSGTQAGTLIQRVKLEGHFHDLLNFYHKIKNQPEVGVVRSATFKKTATGESQDMKDKVFLEVVLIALK